MTDAEAADIVAIARLIDGFAVLLDEARNGNYAGGREPSGTGEIATYPYPFDRERSMKILALFAKDGVIHSPFGRAEGHDELVASWQRFAARASTGPSTKYVQHHMTSKHIEVRGDTATAVSYVLSVSDRGLDSWGRYDDRLVKLEEGWRFAERRVTVTDSAVGSWFGGVPDVQNPAPK